MDILEPMRRASELGCEDFFVQDGCVWVALSNGISLPAKNLVGGEIAEKRINRFAANRCECWWREHAMDNEKRYHEAGDMIDLCRAFANEHGK